MLGQTDLTTIAAIIVSIIVSLTVHEFMHAYVGHRLGDTTAFEAGRVSFNPLQHIDPFMTVILPIITVVVFGVPFLAAKPVPFNPDRVKYDDFGAAMIAGAGPLSNLVLAIVGSLLLHTVTSGIAYTFLHTFVVLNVAVFVFNLVPIPPLDGSRVLYAFAPDFIRDFFDTIEPYGIFILLALIMLGGAGGALGGIQQAVYNALP